jgi:peroxiredoxin family protein
MANKPNRRPMTLMMISDQAERIHMALMVGATAAATGRPVTYFFSKTAIMFLNVETRIVLKTSAGEVMTDMDAALIEKEVADTGVLLDGLAALDVRFVACETALVEHDVDRTKLITRPAVEISGLADVLEKGAGGDWLTF